MLILVVSDTHFPFVHQSSLENFFYIAKSYGKHVTHIVHCGDLYDMLAQARFSRDPNVFGNPLEETQISFQMAKEFWYRLSKTCKNSKNYLLRGNHDIRAEKKIKDNAPDCLHLLSVKHLFTFDKVETIFDHRQFLTIGDWNFFHGFMGRMGAHVNKFGINICTGHIHRPYIYPSPIHIGKQEMNVGYLADPNSTGLSYTPTKTTGWTHAMGVIDQLGPRNILL